MPRYIDAEKLMLSLMTDPVGRMLIREYNVDKFIDAQPTVETRLETAKRIIKENIKDAQCGLFDCRNFAGDQMFTVYENEELQIDICYYWSYFEVFGLSEKEFAELQTYYNDLCNSDRKED